MIRVLQITLLIGLLMVFQGCQSLFYHPSHQKHFAPEKFGLEHKEHWTDSPKLYGWQILPKGVIKPKSTVVFFHGNAQNISSHFVNLSWMAYFGHEVYVFDYSGYGRSPGKPSPKQTYEDAIAMLDYVKKRARGPLIVYCQSLGGIICSRALVDWKHKDQVYLLVLDSTFDSYRDIVVSKLRESWWTTWLRFFVPSLSPHYNLKEKLDRLTMPTLVIHGRNDKIVPLKFGKRIFRQLPGPKKKWFIQHGRHIQTFDTKAKQEYFLDLVDNVPWQVTDLE